MINEKKTNRKTNKNKSLWDFSMTSVLIYFIFRIPISNILGSNGNGYFALTWEIYTILGILLGGFIGNTIPGMIKLRMNRQQFHNSSKILTASLLVGIILSGVGAALIYFLSDFLTGGMFDMLLSGISLRLTAVLLICNVIVNVYRGYFEGTGTKIPTYFSKIIEALVSGTAICILAFLLGKYGKKVGALLFDEQFEPAFAAMGSVIGLLVGSVFALIFLIVVNVIYQIPLKELYKRDETKVPETFAHIVAELFKMSVLTILPALFVKGYRLLNIGIYIRSNMPEGTEVKTIQQIGSYHGRILVLLGLISVFVLGITGKNIRKIRHYYSRNNYKICRKCVLEDLKFITIFSVVAAVVLLFWGKNILQTLFKSASQSEVKMLQIGCIGIIFITIAVYLYRILNIMKSENMIILISFLAFVVQTIAFSVLVKLPDMGNLSLVGAEVVFWLLAAVLEAAIVFRILQGKKIPFWMMND